MTPGRRGSAGLVRFAGLPASKWMNGRGETVELARDPGLAPFQWRLSIATITNGEPFSPLPGVARALLALDGPLELLIDGRPHHLARFDSVSFRGDQDVRASPPPTPQRDLNLMTRGGTPSLEVVPVRTASVFPENALAVVVLAGDVSFDGITLEPGDIVTMAAKSVSLEGSGLIALATDGLGSVSHAVRGIPE